MARPLHQQLGYPVLTLLALVPLVLGGCGSTRHLTKTKKFGSELASKLSAGSKVAKPKTCPAAAPSSYPPLPLDEDGSRVKKFVRHYAYKQRNTMRRYLVRAEKYLPMARNIAKENGVPPEIAYLFMLESGANPEARSPANAVGMWQFMPATARSYGLRVDSWVDERLDPAKSTRSAMLYLKDLYGMFGCWRLALSAYNSGENKLNRVLCQEDADEYDEICKSRKLKRETREFWPRFHAIAKIARAPEKYGFPRVRLKPFTKEYELLTVKGAYSVPKLARLVGLQADKLAELNPSLLRGMTPPRGSPFRLRVPWDKKVTLARLLKKTPTDRPKRHIVHVVHKGDNVRRIARRYRVTSAKLASFNPDVNLKRRLKRGERLIIPVVKKKRKKKSGKRKRLTLLEKR